jgi:predicted transcriptional regulator
MTRTQIYLTDEQRKRIDEIAKRTNSSMAEVIRQAVDAYIDAGEDDDFLDATFGAAKGIALTVPSRDEWDHRGRFTR